MATAAQTICATRGALLDVASTRAWITARPGLASALHGKTLVYFNGAFSPPTRAHGNIAAAALQQSGVDVLWIDPEPARPGKECWLDETLGARVAMCELMAADVDSTDSRIGVGTLRTDLGPELGQSPELFRALRVLVGEHGKLIWALGADVFEGMHYWREKASQCLQPGDTCDGLFLFTRGSWTEQRLEAAVREVGNLTCEVKVLPIPQASLDFSSTAARQAVVRESILPTGGDIGALQPSIARFCLDRPDLCKIYEEQVAVEMAKLAAAKNKIKCGSAACVSSGEACPLAKRART